MRWGWQSTGHALSSRHCYGSAIVVIAAVEHRPLPECLSSYQLSRAQIECPRNAGVQSMSRIQISSLGDTAIPAIRHQVPRRRDRLKTLAFLLEITPQQRSFLASGVACEYHWVPVVPVSSCKVKKHSNWILLHRPFKYLGEAQNTGHVRITTCRKESRTTGVLCVPRCGSFTCLQTIVVYSSCVPACLKNLTTITPSCYHHRICSLAI